ncbi:MAG TPA: ethylbenzene dehydrogenase-related protein [candidate division Zixibacteria bacterium]|nr:ethylbenzene dehydrogenase-related protein [candidate division Zixibacteria bacterium]
MGSRKHRAAAEARSSAAPRKPGSFTFDMLRPVRRGAAKATFLLALSAVVPLALAACAERRPPVSEAEVKAVFESKLPSTADDRIWERVPLHTARLVLQDMVEPRLMQASTPFVEVQAVTDGREIVFRLSWPDPTRDEVPGPGRFSDAVAVQLPAATTPDVPAPQMGEEGRPVEITYWSAVSQAIADGRKDEIGAIYPRAALDHYPFEAPPLTPGSPEQQAAAKRYAPARNVDNPVAAPRTAPVQDLVAQGPGTLQVAPRTVSRGHGKYGGGRWFVLLARPLPSGAQPGGRTQVAFAVWEGSRQEVGARKMRSVWIPLAFEAAK